MENVVVVLPSSLGAHGQMLESTAVVLFVMNIYKRGRGAHLSGIHPNSINHQSSIQATEVSRHSIILSNPSSRSIHHQAQCITPLSSLWAW